MLGAIGAVVLVAGMAFAATWPGFDPQTIEVVGNRVVSRSNILARASIASNVNMWLQNTGAIAARVERIPYIARATVHRLPPTTMTIAVSERVPFALVRSGRSAAVVDRHLRVLSVEEKDPALPVFTLARTVALVPGAFLGEPSALALRDDYAAMVSADIRPNQLAFDRFGGLVARLPGGVRILLGDDGTLDKKLPLIEPILTQVVRKQRSVQAIDLRAPNTPVIVYR